MVNVYEIRPGSYATVAEAKEGGSGSDVTKEYVDAGLAEKQDKLTAGANITIVENVISATGELAGTEWGEIGGSMSDQTDLVNALNAKASASDVAGLTTRVGNAESAIAGLDASKASKTELSAVEAEIPDVSGLATKTEVTTGLAGKQNVLTAGDNITIVGDVISATGGSAPSNMMTTDTTQVIAKKTLDHATGGIGQPQIILKGGSLAGGIGLEASGAYVTFVDVERTGTIAQPSDERNTAITSTGSSSTKYTIAVAPQKYYFDQLLDITGKTYDDVGGSGTNDFDRVYAPSYWVKALLENKANMQKGEGAPTTATVGAEADFYYDTTNDKLYQCTAADTTTPAYTWVEVGGSGSAPTNMVTTDTAQTITARKVFDIPTSSTMSMSDVTLSVKGSSSDNPFIAWFRNGTGSATRGVTFFAPYGESNVLGMQVNSQGLFNLVTDTPDATILKYGYAPSQIDARNRRTTLYNKSWAAPENTITGDGTTTQFTVNHHFDKMPAIVQVTDSNGVVVKDSEITITKTTTNVSVTFTTAPAADATYTVAMLY